MIRLMWFICLFALLYLAQVGVYSVQAAGNTSTDANPGQVKTASNPDGTVYLTTSVNGTSPNTTSTNKESVSSNRRFGNLLEETVRRPEGFADNLGAYINSIMGIVIVVCLLLVFFNFIQAGLQWITSGGDKGKTEEARNKIVHASIGILIVSSSFALLEFVAYILGFESVNDALMNIQRINPA